MYKNAFVKLGEQTKHVVECGRASAATVTATATAGNKNLGSKLNYFVCYPICSSHDALVFVT